MKAAILTIGDELLYGQTVDTNSAFLGIQLAELGYDPVCKETVGDDIETIEESIIRLSKRFKLVIATGGLGPTHDDVTKKAICRAYKKNLVLYEDVLKFINEKYRKRGIVMPAEVESQALLPQGCQVLENEWGTAPGILINQEGSIFVSLPGVPFEMKNLFTGRLKPLLPQMDGGKSITFKRLKTSGIRESDLYTKVKDLLAPKEPVKLAFLPGYSGVDLRLTIKDKTRAEAIELIEEFEKKLREHAGKYIYAENDKTMPEIIAETLTSRRKTLSVAESCTGGLLSKLLTDIPGSSVYFERGAVTYSNEAKMEILGVPAELIEKHGAVSQEVAEAMAKGIRESSKTDFSLSITGISGPSGGTDDKPVGTTWIALSSDNKIYSKKFVFVTDRELNRSRAAMAALNMLRLHLIGKLDS
ncbi:MAG: competence/damage-inducible protein A [candidate division Zixibacteria bacterium]|nr:competence/damage-inducible protein A [candidate division Zixibacteria bacterium]